MSRKLLEPYLRNIKSVFDERKMYEVPIYQRPYSWEEDQINVLLDDIFEAYSLPEEDKQEGYFIGSIYIHDKDEKIGGTVEKYNIIDGQQRLTTIALLLLSIYSIVCQKGIPDNDSTYLSIKNALWKPIDSEYDKKNRAITLKSIEEKSFSDLYDRCFLNPKDILSFCNVYNYKNKFEKNVLDNFKAIYSRIYKQFEEKPNKEILKFINFLFNYVQVIAIECSFSIGKAFSIFESINSKGKILEDIDKIKTYIFSKLSEDSHEHYLNLWGKLITETNNNLYDYLYNYIKAYIAFYRQKINIDNFKRLCERELIEHFKSKSISDALAAFLDDLCDKVKYYKMLGNLNEAFGLVNNNEFRFYFAIFVQNNYQHPKALFLRCLNDYAKKELTKEDLVSIVRETVKFMFEFTAICGRESKDAITMFATIMNEIYASSTIRKEVVIGNIANTLMLKSITTESLKSDLEKMDGYSINKKTSAALLALYESTETDENGKVKISYDKAYTLLDHFGQTFSLDHLLVQTPPPTDPNFKYYKDEKDCLVLKEGHDFESSITKGMDYDLFTKLVLNKIGNLRLWYRDQNSSRKNEAIQLNDYEGFYTYKQICERGEKIIRTLVEKCLPMPTCNTKVKLYSDRMLPKMKDLIEYGLINVGDKVYLVNKPENSEAILINEKYVNYNGEKMTLNQWGCKLTGWRAIQIYAHVAIVGETETLQDKRKKYIMQQEQDEEETYN